MSSVISFTCVPQEVLAHMFDSYVDLKTRAMCCMVSKQWRDINQAIVTNAVTMAANINKSIPCFIGYNYLSEGKLVEKIKSESQPSISTLIDEIASQCKLKKHSIAFEGKIKANGTITLEPIERDIELKAVALEFDQIFSKKENKAVTILKEINFVLEVFWNKVPTNFNGNYTQLPASFQNFPVKYDIHTFSSYQREGITISKFDGLDSLRKTLEFALKFITQSATPSIALKPDGIFDAEVWSKSSLFGKHYTYI